MVFNEISTGVRICRPQLLPHIQTQVFQWLARGMPEVPGFWHLGAVALEIQDRGMGQVVVAAVVGAVGCTYLEMDFVGGEEGHPLESLRASYLP